MDDPDSEMKDSYLEMAKAFPVTASLGPVDPLLRQLRLPTTRPEGVSEDKYKRFRKHIHELCKSLMDHSEAEKPSLRAKSWMSEIRELFNDTNNYFEDALTSKPKKKTARSKFKVLEARAEHAKKRLQMYEIDQKSIKKPKLPSTGRRLPVLHPELIDRGRMDKLATLLHNEEEKQLKVVSLVGLEGVGKTTLAKRIYHKTGGQFQCRAFVRVSPNPDMRRHLTSIFTQIQLPGFSSSSSEGTISQPACCLDAQDLITNIKDYLRDKRYFIIIDDLWSTSVWDIIRQAFPDGGCHSRIITTTQFGDVASACCSYQSKYIFEMEPLKYDQSRKLFFSMVFGSEDILDFPEGIREVSSEIIEKCGGLPLSIVNIASLLPTEESEIDSKQWIYIRDSLPSTLRTNPTSEGIKEVLNLIYNNLSPVVKTCLLYLVVYPEGYTISKDDLVKQWVIEGFIGEGKNREEIAGVYFDELVSRGMIQAVDINYHGVLSCTLHHMVHDLIANKSMEENFIISVDYFQSAIGLLDKVRRLSLQFGGARSARIPAGIMMSEVRSLAFFGFCGYTDFIKEYKLLRVLTLHVWADQDKATFDLSGITKLLPLRYLKIACNIAVKLPRKIQWLQYLEMLEVDAKIVAIPSGIRRLSRLTSLKIAVRVLSRQDILILQKLGALTALSVEVKTAPTKCIVFGKGGFLLLKFFTFRCSAPRLLIEENAMPKIETLDLCLNAHEARHDGKKPITIEHLASLKEISVKIWGAVADQGSALTNAVTNDARNPIPIVQLLESREDEKHGTQEQHDEIMEEDHDETQHDYSGKYENEEVGTSNVQDMAAGIERHMTFDLNGGDYADFIRFLCDVLMKHDDAEHVQRYPVLAKQQFPKEPKRWMHIKLVAGMNETTLAVRDDNVYLIGFQAQNGRWYEFGFIGRSTRMLPGSTFLECDVTYSDLLQVHSASPEETNRLVREEMMKLKLGKTAAIEAVGILSGYSEAKGGVVDTRTRRALARLMLMFCEATRMIPFFDTVSSSWNDDTTKNCYVRENQAIYIWYWGILSAALREWEATNYKSWGPNETTVILAKEVNIKSAEEALAIVQVLLNTTGLPFSPDNIRRRGFPGLGRPLVEVFGVRADYGVVGTISVFDGRRGQTIYRHHAPIHDSPSQSQMQGMIDLALTGPYRAISAEGSFLIQVDGIISRTNASDEPSLVSGDMSWDCYSDEAVYNKVLTNGITTDKGQLAEVTYAVLSDAVEATVQVQLKLKGEITAGATARVYGEITAHNQHYGRSSALLFNLTKEQEVEVTHTSDGLEVLPIPLARSVVAMPLDSPLVLRVKLHAACPPNNENIVFFDKHLVLWLVDQHTREIEKDGVVVQVKITSPEICALPEQSDTTLPALAMTQVPEMTSTRTDAGIPIKKDAGISYGARPIEEHLDLRVDLANPAEDYAAFIDDLRRKLADHPGKASVHGRTLLARRVPGEPARLFMINLAGYSNDRVTLAIQEDNLCLVGFKNLYGRWSKFGYSRTDGWSLQESTALWFGGIYQTFLFHTRYLLHELQLGRMSAITAIRTLSSYQEQEGHDTDLALARLMVMICESARFAPIYDKVKEGWYNETVITEQQVEYIHNWENISHFLLGRRKRVSNIGFKNEAEAADVVHLVLNPPQSLVELLGLRADPSSVRAIAAIDEKGHKVILYKRHEGQRDDDASSQEIGFLGEKRDVKDLPLTATYRPVSASGEIHIQVDGIPTTDTRLSLLWDGHSDKAEYDKVKTHSVTIAGSAAVLTYVVLREAVEATVKVQLNLKEHEAGTVAGVYGEITATNRHYGINSVLLFSHPKEQAIKPDKITVDALDAVSIPLKLMRDFVVAPLNSELKIKVRLFATSSSYEKPISLNGDLYFHPSISSEQTKKINASQYDLDFNATQYDLEFDPICFDQELRFNPYMGSKQTMKIDEPTLEAQVMVITSA